MIILDLCGGTGSWSEPYRRAGYDVRIIDPRQGTGYVEDYRPPADVHGVLAAPPCTVFASSGARWKWSQHRTPFLMRQGYMTAYHCLRIIAEARPKWWALENPVGILKHYIGDWWYTFQPWEYGDPWYKRTCIWGKHWKPALRPCEKPPREVVEIRHNKGTIDPQWVWKLGPGADRAAMRALTPPGYAQAFYEANP